FPESAALDGCRVASTYCYGAQRPHHAHRKLVRSSARFINKGTDASIINLTPTGTCAVSDLKASRNDIRTPLITTTFSAPADPPELCMSKSCRPPSAGQLQVTCAALLPDGLTMPATSRFPFFAYLFACLLGLFALGGFWYGL